MGGSGKTPRCAGFGAAAAKRRQTTGDFAARLWGVNCKPLWVDKQDASVVGDEALQHMMIAPTFVSRNRAVGAKHIEENKAITHIVMDDGLQNSQLKKDLCFLVVDGEQPFGNEYIFPAGPLREPITEALKRVQALIILGEDRLNVAARYQFLMPVFRAQAQLINPEIFAGKPVIAFAGIEPSRRNFSTAYAAMTRYWSGNFVRRSLSLVHGRRREKILTEAEKSGRWWLPRARIGCRLPQELRDRVVAMDAALVWSDENSLTDFLKQKGML